jgi:hypothetical protein
MLVSMTQVNNPNVIDFLFSPVSSSNPLLSKEIYIRLSMSVVVPEISRI